MTKPLLLALALLLCALGMAWLALGKEVHWQQVRGGQTSAPRRVVLTLHLLGALSLAASLLLCLTADHASMAVLVWVMATAGSAWVVAFSLSWRPRLLALLVAWAPASAGGAPDA